MSFCFQFPLLLIAILAGATIYVAIRMGVTAKLAYWVGIIIQTYVAMPNDSDKKDGKSKSSVVISELLKMILSDWYSVLFLITLWFIMFKIDIGSDMIVSYIENLYTYSSRLLKFLSLFSLFGLIFMMAMSIWIIPFFLFSKERGAATNAEAMRFYINTKLLSIMAVLPFYIIANAFFFRSEIRDISWFEIILTNVGTVVFFLLFEFIITKVTKIGKRLDRMSRVLVSWGGILFANNRYLVIFIKVLVIQVVFTIVTTLLLPYEINNYSYILIGIFTLLSSSTVFRVLFFTDESKHTGENIQELVAEMTDGLNKKANKTVYIATIIFQIAITAYYFLTPSLTATNTIYVVLIAFALLIIYLDFLRYLTAHSNLVVRITGWVGIIVFTLAPFISPKDQFNIIPTTYEGRLSGQKDGVTGIDSLLILENAIDRRLKNINDKDSTGNIYLVCAMGGGSRAGYFTAKVLNTLETAIPGFWDQTLAFSTISGGSVGVYHYLKGRQLMQNSQAPFLRHIYSQNYNTSGVFGFLLGDSFEAVFGGFFIKAFRFLSRMSPNVSYHDRNVRIREEYEYAMQAALSGRASHSSYFSNTFRSGIDISKPDKFRTFFSQNIDTIPIHLVNTFEINNGQRTVLSPFVCQDINFFPNAILPLQSSKILGETLKGDITYREAVNLSELFPFLSAASTLASDTSQFVDGGYFENYGLATAFDLLEHLAKKHPNMEERVKIVLIKNSLQLPKLEGKNSQIFAPLVGVVNAPFTGHANHFLEDGKRKLGPNRLIVIEFNSEEDSTKVSLTRALTNRHMVNMDGAANDAVEKQLSLFP